MAVKISLAVNMLEQGMNMSDIKEVKVRNHPIHRGMRTYKYGISETIQRKITPEHSAMHPIFARMMNFFKWWLGFTGLISATSICPFCGQPGCPAGVGIAGVMGGVFALFMQNWKEPFRRLYRRFGKKEVSQ